MPSTKGSRSGMQGVFLVAAELSGRGFIVSVTSRNASAQTSLLPIRNVKTHGQYR